MSDKNDANPVTEARPRAGLRASGPRYVHVAERLFNTPLLIHPDKLQAITYALSSRFGIAASAPEDPRYMAPEAFDARFDSFDGRSYLSIDNGVAVLEISGSLVHKGAWLGTYSGMTSYDGIAEQLRLAVDDERVNAILLNVHSYGGEVAGCFDLADKIFALRGQVPIVALVADAACSAAYALACAADEVVVTQTAMVGSVGVVMTHFDYSEMARNEGVAITHIHAGKEKTLGSPYKPLSKGDKAKLQGEIDQLYDVFVAKVARNRGLDEQAVRDTEAAVFLADEAVARGLADRISTGDEVLADLQDRYGNGALARQFNQLSQEMTMSKENGSGGAQATAQQQIDAARAEGVVEGTKAGAAAERARISSILTHAEANGRESLAQHLAFKTDTTPDAAAELLAASAKTSAATPPKQDPLASAMEKNGTPGVSAEGGNGTGSGDASGTPVINAASIFANRAQSTRK